MGRLALGASAICHCLRSALRSASARFARPMDTRGRKLITTANGTYFGTADGKMAEGLSAQPIGSPGGSTLPTSIRCRARARKCFRSMCGRIRSMAARLFRGKLATDIAGLVA